MLLIIPRKFRLYDITLYYIWHFPSSPLKPSQCFFQMLVGQFWVWHPFAKWIVWILEKQELASPSSDHHVVFPSLSSIQVNYFLFLCVCSLSPFPGPSTFPSTHTGLAMDRQLCSKSIFVYLPALENPPTRPWNWPEGSNLRAKVCHYCRTRSYFYLGLFFLVSFFVTYWPFVLLVPAC